MQRMPKGISHGNGYSAFGQNSRVFAINDFAHSSVPNLSAARRSVCFLLKKNSPHFLASIFLPKMIVPYIFASSALFAASDCITDRQGWQRPGDRRLPELSGRKCVNGLGFAATLCHICHTSRIRSNGCMMLVFSVFRRSALHGTIAAKATLDYFIRAYFLWQKLLALIWARPIRAWR
jgi:hypothetical protein